MVKKKKDGKKKKTKEILLDHTDTSTLKRENLEEFLLKLQEELDKEREKRTFFQIERDKILTFWEISRDQLEDLKNELRNAEREKEEEELKTEQARHTQTQQDKHLQYEQAEELSKVRVDLQSQLRLAQVEFATQQAQLVKDKKDLLVKLSEQELSSQDKVKKVRMNHAKDMNKARTDFEQSAKELVESGDDRLTNSLAQLEAKRKIDAGEVENRKNKQISDLIRSHAQAFEDLRSYYNDITVNNLALLNKLKKEMEDLQQAQDRAEKIANDALTAKRNVSEPLEKALEELVDVKKKAQNAEKDRAVLINLNKVMETLGKQWQQLKWECEVLEQRYDKAIVERDALKERLDKALLEMQQKAALKGALAKKCGLEFRNKPGVA